MKILVINCGSSTIKFQLIEMEKNEVIVKGRCDKVGYDSSNIIYKNLRDNKVLDEVPIHMPNHKEAMKVLLEKLQDKDIGVIKDLSEVFAVGHRVVHGGEKFTDATLITSETLNEIEKISPLAPLHNPGCIMGIKAIMEVAPSLKNVAVFDTAFHQTMPDFNYIYAIDYKYYEKYKIRRYGFHGTSYMYILSRLEKLLNKQKEEINAIVCHMGGGASICAIKNGKSYDTSMGFTPLEGLVMETRSGDIDPAIVTKIMREENLSIDEVEDVLNKKSGRQGLCNIGDFRMMKEAALEGNEKAILARNVQCNRTKKYIGAYMAELNRIDAIVFTGGVAENNDCERSRCVSDMEELGIVIDDDRNKDSNVKGNETLISADTSKIKVYMIPTNEELEIAKQTVGVIEKC